MKTEGIIQDLNRALGLGSDGPSGFQGFTPGDWTAHESHELEDSGEACQACGMRAVWKGISDKCRGTRQARRMGVHPDEVPVVFAMLWADFIQWWRDRGHSEQHTPTVDEWLHQFMEFRIVYRPVKGRDWEEEEEDES